MYFTILEDRSGRLDRGVTAERVTAMSFDHDRPGSVVVNADNPEVTRYEAAHT